MKNNRPSARAGGFKKKRPALRVIEGGAGLQKRVKRLVACEDGFCPRPDYLTGTAGFASLAATEALREPGAFEIPGLRALREGRS